MILRRNLGLSDMSKVTPANFKGIMQMIIPGSTLYVTSLWAIKFALVIFYKNLAAPGSRLVVVYNVALAAFDGQTILPCSPKAAEINYWITIFFNIFTDVVIICLPITMVSRLQMKLKDKLGVAGIFALGFFVVIASIIRAYYSKKNEIMLTCTVSMIETAIAIIATCLPALRSMFLGSGTTQGESKNSYGRHYELSSARRKANGNHLTANNDRSGLSSTHHTHNRANGSEESLFSNNHLQAGDVPAVSGKITVNTQIETIFEDTQSTTSSGKVKSPFT
ncbi:hypothetical protein ACEQ8H_003551 [Pleosporales sp. CAS-2024a]